MAGEHPNQAIEPGELALDPYAAELGDALRDLFDRGRLLALPTETVYGLAAPIDRPDLIARIFALKGRPPSNPLIVHVGSLEQARRVAGDWPEVAEVLAQAFWPGPLTLVLPRSAQIDDAITAGRDTVAVRMPDHPVALAVLRALDVPLVAPSANLFTRLSPTRAEDVRAVFPRDQVEIIDGGPCQVGLESTIVGLDSAKRCLLWLRPGAIDREQIRRHLPSAWRLEVPAAMDPEGAAQSAPGRMREHYRPDTPLHVHLHTGSDHAERLRVSLHKQGRPCILELPDTPETAARELYRLLRSADREGADSIELLLDARHLAAPAWEAVINRLYKAASIWHQPTPA
ncbi:MAG: L-threonylcarbamoyladenylate synthase [Wenzhouxiangella sp.]